MITKETRRSINREIMDAIDVIAAKYGVSVEMGSTRFSETEFTTKYTVAERSLTGVALTQEAVMFNQIAEQRGWKFRAGDKVSSSPHKVFGATIVGYNPRAHKAPILISQNGKSYKTGESFMNYAVKG